MCILIFFIMILCSPFYFTFHFPYLLSVVVCCCVIYLLLFWEVVGEEGEEEGKEEEVRHLGRV